MRTSTEGPRGCGYRSPGGLYLVTDAYPMAPCGKLPIPLGICPTCSGGIKPARGWTWIEPGSLFDEHDCPGKSLGGMGVSYVDCVGCPLRAQDGRAGLLWIGTGFYASPDDWISEVRQHGVSRKIHNLPKGFEPGKTRVFVASQKAVRSPCPCREETEGAIGPEDCDSCDGTGTVVGPGIFHSFVADRVEYVVSGEETEEKLEGLASRGIEPVKVERLDAWPEDL